MPPQPPISAERIRISRSLVLSQNEYTILSKLFLLLLVAVTGLRLAITKYLSRKRRITAPNPNVTSHEKSPVLCQASPQRHIGPDSCTQSQDHQTPFYEPVYPWVSPPQTLPGPYDPRLYPLPTLRRHSYDPIAGVPKEDTSISYARRVSLNSVPARQSTLHGTVTVSTKGWRRNQWIISGE